MREVYSNVSKIMIESSKGSNLLYLPLDKLMQSAGATAAAPAPALPTTESTGTSQNDVRSRDNQRSRERESR
jgi:membrane protease subunit HflK